MTARQRQCLEAARDGRLFAQVSASGSLDVFERAKAPDDFSTPTSAATFKACSAKGWIRRGANTSDRWFAYELTPRGAELL